MMFDVAVVGAGPAGLAAAVHAAEAGLSVVLIDAGHQPGGQFWRHADENASSATGHRETASSTPAEKSAEGEGHHDWKRFSQLRARLYSAEESGAVAYWRNTQVWLIEGSAREDQVPEGTARRSRCTTLRLTPTFDDAAAPDDGSDTSSLTDSGTSSPAASVPDLVRATHVILCPGGYDRQLPVPGWELPGVMAAGGVQALLKGSGTAAGSVAVVGGTGPFLLPVATGLAKAGVKVAAICEANSPLGWLRQGAGAIRAPEKAGEGLEYAAALARHRIPYKVRTAVTSIHGTDRVEAVTISKVGSNGSPVPGSGRRIACDLVALGWGFSAQLELVMAAGAETEIDVDGSLVAIVDERMMSTVLGVSVAGEATGVGGAAMAVTEGELAALCVAAMNAAMDATSTEDSQRAARIAWLTKDRARLRAFAVAMHRANPVPARWHEWLTPETTVCRCEEVSYGSLCEAHEQLGADDARSLKSFARPGMGWCQGRVCGYATAGIAAHLAARPLEADDLRAMSKRSLAAPISLGKLAALDFTTDTTDTSGTPDTSEPPDAGAAIPQEKDHSHGSN